MNDILDFFNKKNLLLILGLGLLSYLCLDGLSWMLHAWERDEYSHGYFIPLVSIYLVWCKREILSREMENGSLIGLLVLSFSILIWLVGEISSIVTLIQYAFLAGLFGLALLAVGLRGVKVIWAALFYLIFMIPLPNFVFFNLSQDLQLISSAIGVMVIRLFDISVFLEGNVIDLGVYQLQVVEACSGLNYLFPLMSFGFLIAYIYKGPSWQKLIIFISTMPITVLMNSFRIGVIGVTVEYFGIAAAEGFLHDFEGWIIFMSCICILLIEIYLFSFFSKSKKSFSELFDLDFGSNIETSDSIINSNNSESSISWYLWAGLVLLVIAAPFSYFYEGRTDNVPDRIDFMNFPIKNNSWEGKQKSLDSDVLDTLKVTDYFIGDFKQADSNIPVNFYTAWYEEQRKGASIHSPRTCLPGGGWEIQSHTIEEINSSSIPFNVNRVVMQMGRSKQLVYYWFHGRNRNITNEYLAKWYIFLDSLMLNRTDGALVRLVTYIPDGTDTSIADERLNDFIKDFYPLLPDYIPD